MSYLPPVALTRAAEALGLPHQKPHFRQGVIDDPELAADIRTVHQRLFDRDSSMLARESSLLRLLAAWVNRHADKKGDWPDPPAEHATVRRARNRQHDHLTEDFRLDDLARVAALSPFHFIRVFEKQYGLKPHAYLMQQRVRMARRLLGKRGRLVDIAAESGFADQAHMPRLFKARYGLTPVRLRKSVQNNHQ